MEQPMKNICKQKSKMLTAYIKFAKRFICVFP